MLPTFALRRVVAMACGLLAAKGRQWRCEEQISRSAVALQSLSRQIATDSWTGTDNNNNAVALRQRFAPPAPPLVHPRVLNRRAAHAKRGSHQVAAACALPCASARRAASGAARHQRRREATKASQRPHLGGTAPKGKRRPTRQ